MSQNAALAGREARLQALEHRAFDLLVVGGGITGVGVARDAALRGLAVALVERDDFASGTSSRSSRLVHGGLRYLEHAHLHLVFESSAERRRLLTLAPHLVRPLAFTWPVYAGARVSRWKLGAGLLLYDALALFRNVARHQPLDTAGVVAREPALTRDGLVGGALYFDAATDDARLTLATALGAHDHGAVVVNHASVRALVQRDGHVTGALVVDERTGRELAVRARVVVNAAGPWSDEVRRLEEPQAAAGVRGTKGVHIAVPRDRVGNRAALTLLAPHDGRVMFVLPAGAHTIVGTTDTETTAAPDDVRASRADVQYLLAAVNHFFPGAGLGEDDVVSSWAGIRPLIAARFGEGASAASREHEITRGTRGVITVRGGKLTTYRLMAIEVVDAVEQALGLRPTRSRTDRMPLRGGRLASLDGEIAAAAATTGDQALAAHLVRAHGDAWRPLWQEVAGSALAEPVVPGLPYLKGELVWAVEREMALTLADLLVRRTHVAFETHDHGRAAARVAAEVVAPRLGWDAAAVRAALAAYDVEAERLFGIDPAPR